jgi:hypothetical protein
MIRVCDEKADLELKAFLVLAPTTGMRKGEIRHGTSTFTGCSIFVR